WRWRQERPAPCWGCVSRQDSVAEAVSQQPRLLLQSLWRCLIGCSRRHRANLGDLYIAFGDGFRRRNFRVRLRARRRRRGSSGPSRSRGERRQL
ncbi:unnamed protein product, partial [Ectocarpus sp. 12 AP-2014]